MSKKFTSFGVLMAAMLLAAPSQAQVQKKAVRPAAQQTTEMRSMGQKLNAAELAKQKQLMLDRQAKAAEAEAVAEAAIMRAPQATSLSQYAIFPQRGQAIAKVQVEREAMPLASSALIDYTNLATNASRAAAIDSHGIITSPDEGEHKYYTRSGGTWYVEGSQAYLDDQSGVVEIVEAADGTVYIKDIVSTFQQGTWVKGTKSGNTITVEGGQPLVWNTNYATTLSANWGVAGSGFNRSTGDITFTIDGDVIALNDADDYSHFVGVFWDDDDSWQGYGDWATIWTEIDGYEPPSTDLVELPAGAVVEDWYAEGTTYYSSATHAVPANVQVSFVDNDVYVKGIFVNMPNAWIKGTIEGSTVSFPTLQYIGAYSGMDLWLYIATSESVALDAATFTYNPEAKTLTLNPGQLMFANAATDRIYYLEYIQSLTLSADEPIQPELVELPAGATPETWIVEGKDEDAAAFSAAGQVAFVGDEVYVQGIFSTYFPNAWLKGTLNGTKVSFETLQFVGDYSGMHMYAYAAQLFDDDTYSALDAVTFTYDAEAQSLTMDPDQILALNAATDRLYYLQYFTDLKIAVPAPIEVPYIADFTLSTTINNFMIVDNNGDGTTWSWSSSNYAYYRWNSSNFADDYLILPIELEAGKNYKVTINAAAHSTTMYEKFEVVAGKAATAAGLNMTIIPEMVLATTTFADYEGEFTANEDGTWYVAIHATSDPDMYYLKVKSFSIELGADPAAPAAPAISVTAGDYGALAVSGSVKAPAKAISGAALTENVKVEIYRGAEVIKTAENVKPGAAIAFMDEVEAAGNYTYMAVASNESGIGAKSEVISVWVGEDMPADIENVQVAGMPTANSISMTWDAVAPANGGYIDVENAVYSITTIEMEDFMGWFTYPVEGETLGTVTGETAATVNYPVDEGAPAYGYFGVKATVGNYTSDPTSVFAYALLGAPYQLPILESFEGKALHYVWDYNENTALGVSDDASDEDGVALAFMGYEAGEVTFETFKLDLASAANATLVFDAKMGTAATDQITVYGILPDGTTADIETVTLTDAYQTFTVVIPESLKADRWMRVGFKADIDADEAFVLLDNIKILDLYQNDLSIALQAPASVQAGNTATIKAIVKNEGETAANGYTVVIKAGEQELLNVTADADLAMFETAEFAAELKTTIFDDAADLAITATVTYAADEKAENNAAEATIAIKESTAPGVLDLAAEMTEDGVLLTWSAPTIAAAEEVTEDFEAGDGGWSFIDADGDGYNWYYHFNTHEAGTDNTTHSGDGSVSSASYDNDTQSPLTPDNWLVSPAAVLNGTFKFWAIGQDADYCAEHFQVWASTTSATDIETFVPVSDEYIATGDYKEYTADLSSFAGANGWVAIRHFNVTDEFVLVVDDITYTVSGGEIDHYNVYVNGELALTVAAGEESALVEAAEGDEVAVSVVYTTGQESKPAVITVAKSEENEVVDGYLQIAKTTVFIPTEEAVADALAAGWLEGAGTRTDNKTLTIDPETEEETQVKSAPGLGIKANNASKSATFKISGADEVRVFTASTGSAERTMVVTATPTDGSGAVSAEGSATGSTIIIPLALDAEKSYKISFASYEVGTTTAADMVLHAVKFVKNTTVGLDNLVIENVEDGILYDLYGRRVETMEAGKAYIMNGKVIIRK